MERYKLMVKGKCMATIPKDNIVLLALHKALENGIAHGNIHDEKTAIEYLSSIGIDVQEEKEI